MLWSRIKMREVMLLNVFVFLLKAKRLLWSSWILVYSLEDNSVHGFAYATE